jgi:hypothetical protein
LKQNVSFEVAVWIIVLTSVTLRSCSATETISLTCKRAFDRGQRRLQPVAFPRIPAVTVCWYLCQLMILAKASQLIRSIDFCCTCVWKLLSVCFAMKACGTWRLRLVLSFRPTHFAAPEEVPRYSTNRKSGEPQTRSGRFGVEIHLLPCLGMEWRFHDRRIPSLVAVPTELFVFRDITVWMFWLVRGFPF